MERRLDSPRWTRALDATVPPDPREMLHALPRDRWETDKARYVRESWMREAMARVKPYTSRIRRTGLWTSRLSGLSHQINLAATWMTRVPLPLVIVATVPLVMLVLGPPRLK